MINSEEIILNSEHLDSNERQVAKLNQTLNKTIKAKLTQKPGVKVCRLNIVVLVLRFVNIITHSDFNAHFHLMRASMFRAIRDKSADYDYYKYTGQFRYDQPSKLAVKLYNWSKNIYEYRHNITKDKLDFILLRPDDYFLIFWNIFMLIMVTMNVLYVSLRLSFSEIQNSSILAQNLAFEQLPAYSYLLEIILKFNTCIYNKGILIENRKKIVKVYLQNGIVMCNVDFLIDFIIVVPFFIGQQINFRYLDLVIIFKVFQISQLTNSLFNRLELSQKETAIFDLTKLTTFIFMVAHFCACIWHALGIWGEWGNEGQDTWLKEKGILDSVWTERYLTSFYWSIVTMTTIGYGDITPVNNTEKIFVIFITMISTAIFGYTVNNIGQIFSDMSKQQVQFKHNMNCLKQYLKGRNVSGNLQIKFKRYFEYLWSKPAQEDFYDQYQHLIPENLNEELITDIHFKILDQIPIFKSLFSPEVLTKLSKNLVEKHIQAEEFIFKIGESSDNFFIFLSGDVRAQITLNEKVRYLERYNKLSMIGQLDYFRNTTYGFDAKAKGQSKYLEISRELMFKIFKEFPKDYERFMQLIHEVQHTAQLELIDIQCRYCNKSTHYMLDCPLIIGNPNKAKVLLRHRKHLPQHRKPFKRTNHRDHSLMIQYQVQENVLTYLIDNEEEVGQFDGIKEQLQSALSVQQSKSLFPSVLPQSTMRMLTFTTQHSNANVKAPSIDDHEIANNKPNIMIRRAESKASYVKVKQPNIPSNFDFPADDLFVIKEEDGGKLQLQQQRHQQKVHQLEQSRMHHFDSKPLTVSSILEKHSKYLGGHQKMPSELPSKEQVEEEQVRIAQGIVADNDIYQHFDKKCEFSSYFNEYNFSLIELSLQGKRKTKANTSKLYKRQTTLLSLLEQTKMKRSRRRLNL